VWGVIYGMEHFRFAFAIKFPVTRIGSESTQPRREYLRLAKAGHITPELAPPIPLLCSRTPSTHHSLLPFPPLAACAIDLQYLSITRRRLGSLLPPLHAGGSRIHFHVGCPGCPCVCASEAMHVTTDD
jgi:hypothetical protein